MECGQLNYAYCLSEIQILILITLVNSGVVWRGRGGVGVSVRVSAGLARLPALADSEFTQLPCLRETGRSTYVRWVRKTTRVKW